MKRPLLLYSISLAAGILAVDLLCSPAALISLLILICLITIFLCYAFRRCAFLFLGLAVFFIIGSLEYFLAENANYKKFSAYSGLEVSISGIVDSEADIRDNRIIYTIRTDEVIFEGRVRKIKGKIQLTTVKRNSAIYEYGTGIHISGQLNLPAGRRNPGGFDYRRYLAGSGISASIFALKDNIEIATGKHGYLLIRLGLYLRHRIVNVINKSLPPKQAGLLNGMLIGYKDGLSDEVQADFSSAGLSHVMAVSGMNIAFIVLPLAFLFRKMNLGLRLSNIIIIAVLVLFVCITGFSPSVVRAAIMAFVILTGQMLKREADVITSLSFAAIILLVINPYNLYNIGFQLSFTATLSIVLFYKLIRQSLKFKYMPEIAADTLAVTLAAQIGVLPVSTFYFNKIQLISPLTNMLAVPLAGIVTVIGFIMAVFGQFSIVFSRLAGYINYLFLSFILLVTKTFPAIPGSVVTVITPSIFIIIIYYFTVLFFFYYKPKYKINVKPAYYVAAVAVAVLIAAVASFMPRDLEVVFLDVGEGDSAFIRTNTGKTVLIDGGGSKPGSGTNTGDSIVIPFLLDYGIAGLDMVIATHGHDDHIQGLLPVMEEMNVKNLIIPESLNKTEFSAIIKIAAQKIASGKKLKIIECSAGDTIKLDDKTTFKVLYPEHEPSDTGGAATAEYAMDTNKATLASGSTLNNSSLVLKLIYKKISILFTGDIQSEAEDIILARIPDLKADVLKVAHHGSEFSSGKGFLEKVNPFAAVVSVGRNNFGHPSPEVLNRLAEAGTRIFRTDECGAVVLRSNGERIVMGKTRK